MRARTRRPWLVLATATGMVMVVATGMVVVVVMGVVVAEVAVLVGLFLVTGALVTTVAIALKLKETALRTQGAMTRVPLPRARSRMMSRSVWCCVQRRRCKG